ncbi:hypothetical protein F5Y17DRAFT_432627 [Xylariaceae sp. FL0594]|nr:hypothetical protein F5Y17DRAFT_432627 [Xylariaceae sp. FL0594]
MAFLHGCLICTVLSFPGFGLSIRATGKRIHSILTLPGPLSAPFSDKSSVCERNAFRLECYTLIIPSSPKTQRNRENGRI